MLCELEEEMNKRYEQESRYCKLFFDTTYLFLQRFQISQSFTYKGQKENIISEDLFDTIDNNFIEDVVDEPQVTLKAILGDNRTSNIIEIWRIHRISRLSHKENLVVLYNDGTHICTCIEMITKRIICCYFWQVMLYSNQVLENLLSLTAIELSMDTTIQVNLNIQSLRNFQGSNYHISIQKVTSQKNRYEVAFSTAKTAINITLKTKKEKENNEPKDSIIALQWYLIDQTSDSHVTKI
ncbi:34789_t:CDS:2 [Gigaspora margarita]|uniref:34789_t:CDS:1 n=1 Tax=Gigaspora margarita TaxID=4874 RepID=A0ABN7USY9_GIGMA|nr:34789_t:CDS:2 [Gigaspora margarita]